MLNVHTKNLGSFVVLSLQGQIVTSDTEALRNAFNSLPEVRSIKVDMSRVSTIDAGGLGTMLQLREQTESRGIRFELMNVPQQVRRVFEITRLDTVFQMTAGVEFFPAVSGRSRVSMPALVSCA